MTYGSWDVRQNRVFCHFGPFSALCFPKVLKKWKKHLKILSFYTCIPHMMIMMHGSWNMEHNRQNFLVFWNIFCPFYNPENYNFEKMKKNTWRYHHFTIVYQKSWLYAYCSWDMMHDRCNYFSFWVFFFPFTPLTVHKIKVFFAKWKKCLKIRCYTVPEIWCATDGQMDGKSVE